MKSAEQIKELEKLLESKEQEVKDLKKIIDEAYSENYKEKLYKARNERRATRSTVINTN